MHFVARKIFFDLSETSLSVDIGSACPYRFNFAACAVRLRLSSSTTTYSPFLGALYFYFKD
jgi:hypothetical protein